MTTGAQHTGGLIATTPTSNRRDGLVSLSVLLRPDVLVFGSRKYETMRLTGSRAYTGPPPVPKMPQGLVELMEGLTRDVLKHNPPNVYQFCANHMANLLELRDGRAPKQRLTLEQKIARAQEKVRQKAEERRRKFDEEIKLRSNKEIKESTFVDISDLSEKESVLKAPVHHEHDLADALEVEIFHNVEIASSVANISKVKEYVQNNTSEELLKDATATKSEDPGLEPSSSDKTGNEEIFEKDKVLIIENTIEHEKDEYPLHVRERRSIDSVDEKIKNTDATENMIDNTANLDKNEEKVEEQVVVHDDLAEEAGTLLKSEESIQKNHDNIVKFMENINENSLDAGEIENEIIHKRVPNIENNLVAITDTSHRTAEAGEDFIIENDAISVIKASEDINPKDIIKEGTLIAEDKKEESYTEAQESIGVAENMIEESSEIPENIIEITVAENDKIDESTFNAKDLIVEETAAVDDNIDNGIVFVENTSDIINEKGVVAVEIVDEKKLFIKTPIDTSALFPKEITDDTTRSGKEDIDKNILGASNVADENTLISGDNKTENKVTSKEKVGEETITITGNIDDALLSSKKQSYGSITNIGEKIDNNTDITDANASVSEIEDARTGDSKSEIIVEQELGNLSNFANGQDTETSKENYERVTDKKNEKGIKVASSDLTVTREHIKEIIDENELESIHTEKSYEQNVSVNAAKGVENKHLSEDFASEVEIANVLQYPDVAGTETKESTSNSEIDQTENNSSNKIIDQNDLGAVENVLNNVALEPTSENENVIDFKVVEKPISENFTPNELPNGHNHDEKSDSENSLQNTADISTSKDLRTDTFSTIKSSSMDSTFKSSNESLIDHTDMIKTAEAPLERDNIPSSMDLETAAVTIQKVFRTFLFKSRGSTFDDNSNDENQTDEDKVQLVDYTVPSQILNKERRTLGINRMESVLQTVNEEKSLSLSMDDSSSLSSAATIIQSHVRGFLVRNRLNSNKTASTSLVNSDGASTSLETNGDSQQKINKTVLNIHIVPEGEHFLSRDESVLTSMELSLDGSPPSSINLHPLGYDKSERRKQLKREDAIQSISPPSNNSGKLSEDSVKEVLVLETPSEQPPKSLIESEDINTTSRDGTPLMITTIETIVDAHKDIKFESQDSEQQKEFDVVHVSKSVLTKMGSNESDVVTPFEEKNSMDSENTPRLLHSGEFHDVVLPTKVSRNDTSVGRGE